MAYLAPHYMWPCCTADVIVTAASHEGSIPLVQLHELASWCRIWLGAEPTQVLFETHHLSTVVGLQLADGREIVLKARPPAPRLLACAQVQHHLWLAGYACPQLLVGPTALGSFTVTAEAYVPGGEQLARSADAPRRFAEALADLVARAPAVDRVPSLAPPPAWVWWDHDQPGIWPLPDNSAADLNAHHEPAWLNDVGRRVRLRLAHCHLPPVIGHADWESQNLRWSDGHLHVVHDWDSVVSQPEAMIAGAAAAVFPASGRPLTDATRNETEAFLVAYAHARGRQWSTEEWQMCWAAGVWVRAFNAKKAAVSNPSGSVVDQLRIESTERLQLAGA
jgi:hypothetical protein